MPETKVMRDTVSFYKVVSSAWKRNKKQPVTGSTKSLQLDARVKDHARGSFTLTMQSSVQSLTVTEAKSMREAVFL